MILIRIQFVMFYIFHERNLCFPMQKPMFLIKKIYVSASGNIKHDNMLFYYFLCLFFNL